MKTVIEMANETLDRMAPDDHCRAPYWTATDEELERFAELVRKDYSTTHANLWLDRIHKFMLEEREACAKVCDEYDVAEDVNSCDTAEGIAIAIRARGQA